MTEAQAPMAGWQRNLLIGLLALFTIFAAGFLTGVTIAAIEDGFYGKTFLLLAAGVVLGLAAAFTAWKLHKARPYEPVAPRIRKGSRIWLLSGLIGAVIGLVLSISTIGDDGPTMFTNGPVPPLAAAIGIAIWAAAVPLLSWSWLKNIDEHEMQANYVGAMAGMAVYMIAAPSWWLGWRGGFLPEPQTMVTFIAVSIVYCSVWAWRRAN